jgi:DNA-binding response OmpR family regulator
MLPGKHGAEVAWYLRRHGVNVPILAISAVLDKWNEDDLYDCGFSGLLAKPFDITALRELAHEIINSK